MKTPFLLILISLVATAQAEYANRLVTKDELVQSFSESSKGVLDAIAKQGKSYTNGSQERADYLVKMNTATPELIERVAVYTEKNLQRQMEICISLQAKYPKAKDASCPTSVMMSNGLGHFDDQRMIMEMMADKGKLRRVAAGFSHIENDPQMKDSVLILKQGVGGKLRDTEIREDDLMGALGFIALNVQTQELIRATLASN